MQVAKWRALAQQHEAAYAEAAAQLHTREAASLTANTQQQVRRHLQPRGRRGCCVSTLRRPCCTPALSKLTACSPPPAQSRADQLQGELEGARRRCGALAARLQEAQAAVAQLRGALAAKEQQAAAQQAAIGRLEAKVAEQQADIRAALDLVALRPGAGGGADADSYEPETDACGYGGGTDGGYIPAAFASGAGYDWQAGGNAAAGAAADGELGTGCTGFSDDAWGGGGDGLGGAGISQFSSLADVGGAADAAAAWVDTDLFAGVTEPGSGTAGDAWEPGAGGASWSSSPQRGGAAASPAPRGAGRLSGAQSLQGSPPAGAASLGSIENDIASLEAALRTALGDL